MAIREPIVSYDCLCLHDVNEELPGSNASNRHHVFTLALDDKLYLAPLPEKLDVSIMFKLSVAES